MIKLCNNKIATRCLILLFCLYNNVVFAKGETTAVSSRNSDGAIFGDGTFFMASSISADGRYIAFHTFNPLDAADTNGGKYDIYLYDRLSKKNTLISMSSAGVIGNGDSLLPSISADGRFIAFISDASNLVDGDTNQYMDIFVHDRVTKQTTRVSVHSNGSQAQPDLFGFSGHKKPSISADGRFVAFSSLSSTLVDNDTNNDLDTFVHDRLSKQTTRVSVNSSGGEGKGNSLNGIANGTFQAISADGRYVAFTSDYSNLVNDDTNKVPDIFMHDRTTKKTVRVSIGTGNSQGGFSSYYPGISANGRFITFSTASSLVNDDTNNASDIFVHDFINKETTRVSVNSQGNQAVLGGFLSDISADGRFVVFNSQSPDLVNFQFNFEGVFIHDRLTKDTSIININTAGDQGITCCSILLGNLLGPSVNADGRYVSFASYLPLAPNDFDNGYDVYLRDRNLDSNHHADLVITNTQKPNSLIANTTGSYQFTVTNNGPDAVNVLSIQHLLSNGKLTGITPSNGFCHRYTSLTICNVKDLPVGSSMTLTTNVTALRNSVVQRLSISSGGRADPRPANNFLMMNTPVTK